MSSSSLTEQLVPDYFNSTFNPSDIVLTYESAFSLETTITFGQLQQWVESKLKYAIIYGTRIGAAGVALLILLIVTKNKKSPIFVINIFLIALYYSSFWCLFEISKVKLFINNLFFHLF
ncbi:unnamed protein product [Hanseniaspora opuntiae]